MQPKSISRELALLLLGQINKYDIQKMNIDSLLSKAIESLELQLNSRLELIEKEIDLPITINN